MSEPRSDHGGERPGLNDRAGQDDRPGDLVVPLSALRRGDLPRAGGKGASLGEMIGAGLPVPPGFCVTTAAYRRVARGSELPPILDALGELAQAPGEAARIEALAARARAALLAAPVPDEIGAAALAAYAALGAGAAVAVRSSATAEDLPEASFAGQQDTILNVIGEAALLDAVRRCWSSLFTDRAVAYRVKNGIDHAQVELAVVVQRMVPAAVAGVLFTANPVTGRRRQAVIDAAPGLGEAVVSGAVNPDHFEVDTESGAVLLRRLGDKRVAVRPLPGGGTRHEAAEAGSGACVSDEELRELARLGARVEAHYGAPQDLEWALDEGRRLYLLQARPVTTLHPLPRSPAEPPDAPRPESGPLRVYFSFSVAQGVLRPLTPMGMQAWRTLLAGVLRFTGLAEPDPRRGPAFVKDAAGRLFLDVTELLQSDIGRAAARFVLPRMEARSLALIEQVLHDPRLPAVRTSRLLVLRRGLPALARTRAPLRALRALRRPEEAHARVARLGDEAIALSALRLGAGGVGAAERIDAVERLLLRGMGQVFVQAVPVFGSGMLCLLAARRLLSGLCERTELDTVLRSLPHNPTTEMDLELWALAQRLRGDAPSADLLRGEAPAALARRFREGSLPAALQSELDRFLRTWGARGVAEIDLGVPRWRDDPTHILGTLANYLLHEGEAAAPDALFRRGAAEAEGMVAELTRRAAEAGPLRGRIVAFLLRRVRALAGGREMPKFQLVRVLGRARELLLAVGEELVAAGRLAAADDVFFLDLGEARAAALGQDQRRLVAGRRAAYARELGRRHLPRVLLSDGTEPEPPRRPGEDSGLSGSPASAGVIEGTARVILDPTGARLDPGEILVAPSTDPGWTPLFLTAGGLVMEMGGPMSHGAVVAREYGIPAVVGVAHATERIRSGQRIRVDGTAGTVTQVGPAS